MLDEAFPVGTVRKGDIKRLGVAHTLLKTSIDCVISVFRLNDGNRDVRSKHEKVVGLLLVLTSNHIPAHHYLAVRKVVLSKDLCVTVPQLHNRWINQLQTCIRLIHTPRNLSLQQDING